MKAEPTMQFLGMSWECPLTLMAPRPPHGLCQLWGAVWWQQGTLEELFRQGDAQAVLPGVSRAVLVIW